MALTKDQKDFIKNKVKKLGSVEKVKNFYKRDSLVCQYAHQYANKIYRKKPKRKLKTL